jgi:hydroxymethylpyrimidine/phosphomethylpyrimidine kinase
MGPLRIVMNADAPRPRVLTIAGSDSGGGAGIQADLKTFSALGAFGMTAVTAVTVQNTLGVSGYEPLPPDLVSAQIRAVASDIGVDAAKTGMLATEGIVEAVAGAIEAGGVPDVVVDPVSVSKHGVALLAADAVDALRSRILPLARLVTPNVPEAAALTGLDVATRADMQRSADALLGAGANAVLIKGGHLADDGAEAADLFADGTRTKWLIAERLDTPHTHGTGCTLSAAIAVHLARGSDLFEAVRAGKAFVTEAIRHALAIGHGIGPVDQLWQIPREGGAEGPS